MSWIDPAPAGLPEIGRTAGFGPPRWPARQAAGIAGGVPTLKPAH